MSDHIRGRVPVHAIPRQCGGVAALLPARYVSTGIIIEVKPGTEITPMRPGFAYTTDDEVIDLSDERGGRT